MMHRVTVKIDIRDDHGAVFPADIKRTTSIANLLVGKDVVNATVQFDSGVISDIVVDWK